MENTEKDIVSEIKQKILLNSWLWIPIGLEILYLVYIGIELIQKRIIFHPYLFQISITIIFIYLVILFFPIHKRKVNIAFASLFFIFSFILLTISLYAFSNCYYLHTFPIFENLSAQDFLFQLKYSQRLFFISILVFFITGFLILLIETKTMKRNRRVRFLIGIEIAFLLFKLIRHYFYALYIQEGEVSNFEGYLEFPLLQFIFVHLYSYAWFNNKIIHIIFFSILLLVGILLFIVINVFH